MADNIKGIPFSTSDEGVDYVAKAKLLVQEEFGQTNEQLLELSDIYVVWFCYILGGWKALLSTPIPDGTYYEVTHNASKNETYVDTYVKTRNTQITH